MLFTTFQKSAIKILKQFPSNLKLYFHINLCSNTQQKVHYDTNRDSKLMYML